MTNSSEPSSSVSPQPGLLAEIAAFWGQLPYRYHFLFLAAGWLVLFSFWGISILGYTGQSPTLLGWVLDAYRNSPDDAHGYFVPAVVLIILWWKKNELLAIEKGPSWAGFGVFALGLVTHVIGFMIQQPRVSMVGFFLGLYGLMGLVWGWQWLARTFFPVCLLVFCIPIGTITDSLTLSLRLLATKITVLMVHLAGIDVIQQGTMVFDPSGQYQYEIAAACSGLRSITMLTAITIIYSFMFFRKFWHRGLILLLAIPAAVGSNVLRLLGIIVAAQLFGQKGGDYVHNNSLLSLLPYLVGFAFIYLVGWWLGRNERLKQA